MEKRVSSGFLIALTGVLLFSAKAVLVKLCYQHEVDTVSVLMLRMGLALPFFIVIGFFKKEKDKEKLNFKSLLIIICLGVLGYYGASYFDFLGLKYVDASLERLILYIYPTVVVILSAIVFRKKISRKQMLSILITYVGVLVIFLPVLTEKEIKVSFFGVNMIVLSAITYASYLVASQYFVPKFGTVRFTTAAMIVSCIMVIVHYLFDSQANVFGLDKEVYFYGVLMAVFSTVLPSYLISEGIKRISASKVSIIGSLGPVSTISLSILLLGEEPNKFYYIGGVIIIAGVVWLNLEKAKN